MQDQVYKLREEVDQLKAEIELIKRSLGQRFGPGFFSQVVTKEATRPAKRPGVWADSELVRFLKRKKVPVEKMTASSLQEHLRLNPELLKEAMAYMEKIKLQCSSDSFREVFNILKELDFRKER